MRQTTDKHDDDGDNGIDNLSTADVSLREIMKARKVAGSVVVSLPKVLRDPLGIVEGDRVMIAIDRRNCRLIITKE